MGIEQAKTACPAVEPVESSSLVGDVLPGFPKGPLLDELYRAGRNMGAAAEFGASAGNNKMTQATLVDASNVNGMTADIGIGVLDHQGRSRGLTTAAQRTSAEADFSAKTESSHALNLYTKDITGLAAVNGAYAGSMRRPDLPQDFTGMALSGMLGQKASSAAHYADPEMQGGFFSSLRGLIGALRSNFGGDYVRSGFRTYSVGAAFAEAGKALAEFLSSNGPNSRDGIEAGLDTDNGKNAAAGRYDRGSALERVPGPDPTAHGKKVEDLVDF